MIAMTTGRLILEGLGLIVFFWFIGFVAEHLS